MKPGERWKFNVTERQEFWVSGDVMREDGAQVATVSLRRLAKDASGRMGTEEALFAEQRGTVMAAAPELVEECRFALRNVESMLYMLPVNANAVERQSLETWAGRIRALLSRLDGAA